MKKKNIQLVAPNHPLKAPGPNKRIDLFALVKKVEELKLEAGESGCEDVALILDATFKLCLSIYYLEKRGVYPAKESN
jgi:hypothetical protein